MVFAASGTDLKEGKAGHSVQPAVPADFGVTSFGELICVSRKDTLCLPAGRRSPGVLISWNGPFAPAPWPIPLPEPFFSLSLCTLWGQLNLLGSGVASEVWIPNRTASRVGRPKCKLGHGAFQHLIPLPRPRPP